MTCKTIAFVPIRSGSKSIPHKNIKTIAGKPLLYWNVNALVKSMVDLIVVATDSEEYANVVKEYFDDDRVMIYFRDKKNATDSSSTEDVMLEFICKYIGGNIVKPKDNFMLVQVTSPLLSYKEIDNAVQLYNDNRYGADSIVSVADLRHNFVWTAEYEKYGFHFGVPVNYDFRDRPLRQSFENHIYIENGAFYLNTVENIMKDENRLSGKVGIYVMPYHTLFEIDDPEDWGIVEGLLMKYKIKEFFRNGSALDNVEMLICDVDGTLTDGRLYLDENGNERMAFNKRDGKGFELLRKLNIRTIWITSEEMADVSRIRAEKLQVDYFVENCNDKIGEIEKICNKERISLENVAYIGDDINCLSPLEKVKYPFCPNDAEERIKAVPNIYVCNKDGGHGCVREVINLIIKAYDKDTTNE